MDSFIETLRNSSATSQAVAVSVGCLVGVFATLGFFWLIIWGAGKIEKKNKAAGKGD